VIDEGYTKFMVEWTRTSPLVLAQIDDLINWRKPLYRAGLIGQYEDIGIGYGNISARTSVHGQFVISGTQTGHLAELGNKHFSLVTGFNLKANKVTCTGPIQASSESMTHATIYALDDSINAVVHVHSAKLWVRLRESLPTTDAKIAYGTPEMAVEFERLYRSTDFPTSGVAIMAGHDDGLVSIGHDLRQAARRILVLV